MVMMEIMMEIMTAMIVFMIIICSLFVRIMTNSASHAMILMLQSGCNRCVCSKARRLQHSWSGFYFKNNLDLHFQTVRPSALDILPHSLPSKSGLPDRRSHRCKRGIGGYRKCLSASFCILSDGNYWWWGVCVWWFGDLCLTWRAGRQLFVTRRRETRSRFDGHFTCAIDAFVEGEEVGDVWEEKMGKEWWGRNYYYYY